MPRPVPLSCPSCAGAIPVWGAALLDCPHCGTALAAFAREPARQFIEPRVTSDAALDAALASWASQKVPRGFCERRRWSAPRLAFAAFYEVDRTLRSPAGSEERLEAGPAVTMPGIPLDRVPLAGFSTRPRQTFDPAKVQRLGIVLDPVLPVADAVPAGKGTRVLDERVRVVYLPLWLVRGSYGPGTYDTAVDASTGEIVGGQAPLDRAARLPGAIAIVYLLAMLAALQPQGGLWYAMALFRLHPVAAVPVLLISVAGLAWLLAWSWERIRFRWQLVREGTETRLVAVNRPQETLPEKVRDGILDFATRLVRALDRK